MARKSLSRVCSEMTNVSRTGTERNCAGLDVSRELCNQQEIFAFLLRQNGARNGQVLLVLNAHLEWLGLANGIS